jgi:glycosyltransferase involved in cell wall biosynthesis
MEARGTKDIEFTKMKLLVVTDGITPFVVGGMQKHSANLVKALVELGHEVTLLHCMPWGQQLPNRAAVISALGLPDSAKLKTICISFPKAGLFPGHYLKESYYYSKNCYDAIKAHLHEFDFIYAKGFSGWYFLHQKSKGEQLPLIGIKFHGYEMFQKPINWRMRLQNWLLQKPVIWLNQRADIVFSYGGKITDLITSIGVDRHRIVEIPTGIDNTWVVRQLTHKVGELRRVLFVGRYERRKGIEELHQVIPTLLDDFEVEFHLIGPIPPSKKYKHERVIYHGQLKEPKEIQKVMDACDILVTPSHSEGMPNVIMEGMARGLAVVATDVGAVNAVTGNNNGVLIPHMNAMALQTAFSKILHMPSSEIDQLRLASIAAIKAFDWNTIGKRTELEIQSRKG